MIFDKLEYLEN